MTDPEDAESRLTELEAEVRRLRRANREAREDAAAARILAGGADRDVGALGQEFREFRDANNRVLNAMRADLTEVRTDLTEVRTDLTEVRGTLGTLASGQQQVVSMLEVLIRRDER